MDTLLAHYRSGRYVPTHGRVVEQAASETATIAPNGGNPIPLPLVLLPGGPSVWNTSFAESASHATTVTATFRFDPAVADPHQFDPYIDTYGQAIAADWPSKIHSDGELQGTVRQEQAWFNHNEPLCGLEQYGGSTVAGWTDPATGYYHTAIHDGHWFLISPLGNPLFYIGLTSIGHTTTPITGREPMFQLPP